MLPDLHRTTDERAREMNKGCGIHVLYYDVYSTPQWKDYFVTQVLVLPPAFSFLALEDTVRISISGCGSRIRSSVVLSNDLIARLRLL